MISIRLESLHLKNWQSYRDVEIDFKGPKSTRNSAILYARNGKGKSAFFESIQFLLYGKEEIKIRDADMQKPLVHKNKGFWPLMNYEAYLAGETELRVRAKFSDKDGKTFEISRGWVAKKSKASESDFTERFVIFDSEKDKIPNPEAFIELMLPKEIVKFFMIDGERLIDYRKLFSPDTATKGGLARATEELLRMYVLDNTIACMGGLTASIKKAKRLEESRLAKAKGKAGKLTKLSRDISTCEKEILELEKKEKKLKEAIDEDLSWMKKNGDEEAIIKKIDDCQDLIDDSEELIGNQKDILGEQIKNSWKAIMSPMITASINAETTKIERQEQQRGEITRLNKIVEDLNGLIDNDECVTCGHKHELEPSELLETYDKIKTARAEIKKLSRTVDSPEVEPLYEKIIAMKNLETDLEFKQISVITKEISRLELVVEKARIDKTKHSKNMSKKHLKESLMREARLAENQSKLELTQGSISIQEIAKEEAETRYEAQKKIGGGKGSSAKVTKYELALKQIETLISVANNSKTPFRDLTRKNLSSRAGDAYLKIIDENHDRFEVDSDFRFKVFQKDVEQPLTPGQKALATYCLLEALSEISDIRFPLIVDSPGQGVDIEYINSIFSHILSLSQRQVIILPSTAEIDLKNIKKDYAPDTSLIAEIFKPKGVVETTINVIHKRKP